jgi:1-acyl-sn-glycerol-3-phosphate acyltransferase
MINFFKKSQAKILQSLGSEALIYKAIPHFVMEIMRRYFRLEIEGLENIPKRGAAVIIPNHSGYSGFDAMILAHIITKEVKRIPRVLTHQFWFLTKTTSVPAHKLGFTEASFENGVSALKRNNLVVIFPEGEKGNFKPSTEMYHLQEFRRGFVRMAISTQSPIVPCLIVGAEETHINLSQLRFTKFLRGTILPLPLNIIPLPAKWKIKFLPPIFLPYKAQMANDIELMTELANDIQEQMQDALNDEVQKRKGFL